MVVITTSAVVLSVLIGTTIGFITTTGTEGVLSSESYLGSESLNPASFFQAGVDAITSPFTDLWNFLTYDILAPIILIIFAILFFTAQYWLFKLYFKLGRELIKGITNIINKISFLKEKNNFVNKFTSFFD